MVDVWFPYNGTEICARIPSENLRDIIRIAGMPGAKDLDNELRRAIREPLGSRRLDDIIKSNGRIALALNINDAIMAKVVVSTIIEEVSQLDLKSSDLIVLIANNPLAPKMPSIAKQLLDEISSLGVNAVAHDMTHESVYAGETESGIKVYLNKVFAESKVKIVASAFEPNPYTIYNCSETGVSLGLSNTETVKSILIPALNSDEAGEIILRNSIDVSRTLGISFSINILRGLKNEVIKAFAGEPEETFQKSLNTAEPIYKVFVERRADLVIVSPGGAPFDANILSACGSLENALKIVRKNGVIILVAECSDGYGDLETHKIVRKFNGDLDALEKYLRDNFSISGFITYRLLRSFKKANIFMVSAIPDYYASEIPGLKIFRSLNEALSYAMDKVGGRASVIAIQHGNLTSISVKEG